MGNVVELLVMGNIVELLVIGNIVELLVMGNAVELLVRLSICMPYRPFCPNAIELCG